MREKRIQEDLIEKFILLCKKKNKLIVATNRTRYTNFNLYNHLGLQILLEAFAPSRISLLHPLFKRKDNQPKETFSPSAQELPNLKLKSGAELTADLNFLKNKKLINEIVYENGRKIFAQITLTNKELINQTKTEKILSIRSSTHKLFFRIFLSLNQLYSPNHSGTKLLLTRVKKE